MLVDLKKNNDAYGWDQDNTSTYIREMSVDLMRGIIEKYLLFFQYDDLEKRARKDDEDKDDVINIMKKIQNNNLKIFIIVIG